jgi:hypothetical protein
MKEVMQEKDDEVKEIKSEKMNQYMKIASTKNKI